MWSATILLHGSAAFVKPGLNMACDQLSRRITWGLFVFLASCPED